jgi:hypothetical protein
MQKTTTIDDLITYQRHLSRIISSKQLEPIEYIIPNPGNPDSVFFDMSPIPKSLGF